MPQEENQQERPTDSLAWFAGIVEGEGHLGMYKQKFKRSTRYVPRFSVVNTDVALIDACAQILKQHEIGFYLQNRKRTPQSKPTFSLDISGIKRLAKLLPLILPYMKGKKQRAASTLLNYIQWRLSQPLYYRGNGFDKERAEATYQTLREINHTGILRDFTPVVLRIEGDDKVRTSWRHEEPNLPNQWGLV